MIWPAGNEAVTVDGILGGNSSIDSLCRGVAQDAMVELQSSLIITLGQYCDAPLKSDRLLERIVRNCQGLMEEKMVCTVTFVEVLDDRDGFRDALCSSEFSQTGGHSQRVGIKHIDMKVTLHCI